VGRTSDGDIDGLWRTVGYCHWCGLLMGDLLDAERRA